MNFFRKNLSTNRRSQIAVIITFVIAVIFLFIAVFINLAKVSQVKTTTSTAADKAALSLASQLGSISHYYKDKVLKISGPCATSPCQVCDDDYVSLAVLIGVVVAFGLMIPATMGASLIALPLALVMTASILSGINAKFTEMTGYNAFRESTLFQALSSIQSDDVELKSVGPGIFSDAETGKNYNLSAIPEMRNQKKVSRFAAWYYALRLPLVGDEAIESAIERFLSDPVGGLRSFVDVDEWDSGKWKINKMSYVIKPGSGNRSYDITCSGSSCPDWVKDSAKGLLRMVEIDSSDDVYGGFLKDKLMNLLSRLEASYNLSFCDLFGCSDVNILINSDLREFLLRSKEVLNMPVSDRLKYLTQWFPLWYDFKKHDQADINKNGDFREPADPADPNKYTYDIYLRLTRDQAYIDSWIAELETINSQIAGTIPPANGHNQYGLGGSVSSCYTQYNCCASDCSKRCCEASANCSFQGIYCSACGSSTPPVCVTGDLYEVKPSWCPLSNRSASCNSSCSSCSRNPQCSSACNFQGQLAYNNTTGPTEVEQAIRILYSLNDNIAKIKMSIGDLANSVAANLLDTDAKRNEIVYAWKDKPKPDGSQQFSHLVKVKIDGYPKSLPNVTEGLEWKWPGPQYCRKLNYDQGDFKITTWRYDQDQPTDIGKINKEGWQLRRRKPGPLESGKDVPPDILVGIVTDVQDNGKIDSKINEDYISVRLLPEYAITSCSQAHYGPEKSDIYISGTKCD